MIQEVLTLQKPVITSLSHEDHTRADLLDEKGSIYDGNRSKDISPLHIQLFGDFRLLVGEEPVTTFDFPRLQSLLAYLVLHSDTPQSRSHLAFLFWPDSTDGQAHTNLRNLLHRLRHALPNADAFLLVERQGLHWQPDVIWSLDVHEFEQAFQQAECCGDNSLARAALERAISLYRGDLLPDCYDEWIEPERDRLRQAYLGALQRLVDLLEQERDYKAAIRFARRLLHQDPLLEESYRCLMRLYALNGDRANALRVYQLCLTTLERELGVKPEQETQQLYTQLKHMDTPRIEQQKPETTPTTEISLVGRQREWEQLQKAWRNASSGRPQMVVLSGDAGIGKTRLAEELATWVSGQGMIAINARCSAMSELSYAPLAAWLRCASLRPSLARLANVWLTELARVVPDVLLEHPDLPQPGTIREGWQQQRFYEALARVFLQSQQPMLLILDDAQWCDRETLTWLHYLLRFDPHARLLVVATVRPDETDATNPLTTLFTSLRRDEMVHEIVLEPLSERETCKLANQVARRTLDARVAAMVYQESEGNPLFIVETVRAGMRESADHCSRNLPTSPRMQAVMNARLAHISPQAQSVVSVAAVIGRTFTWPVLIAANGGDEEALVSGLDVLWQRGIVREQDNTSYAFSYEQLRKAVYSTLSAAQRRLLHRRVAEALETVYAHDLDANSEQIAMHYELAGLPQLARRYARRLTRSLSFAC